MSAPVRTLTAGFAPLRRAGLAVAAAGMAITGLIEPLSRSGMVKGLQPRSSPRDTGLQDEGRSVCFHIP